MEGKRPLKGRKSLLTQQAELAGVSFVDSIPDLPRNSLIKNAANPTLQNRKTPAILPSLSELATPVNQPIPMSRGQGGSSQIPVPRRLPLTGPRSTGLRKPGLNNERSGQNPQGRAGPSRPPVSGTRLGRNPLRRSISVDSSLNMTDAAAASYIGATPSGRRRSQSPGPQSTTYASVPFGGFGSTIKKSATKGGRAGDINAKTIHAPMSTDKSVLSTMISLIIEILDKLQYEKKYTMATFKMLNVKDFHTISVFLLSFLIGPNTGPNKKDDQTFILEGVQKLAYTGTLNKSHLKTPNVPHTQPIVYTFLSWLCCYVDAFMNPESNSVTKHLNILSDDAAMDEVASDSYTRLFFTYLATNTIDMTDELDRYRERVKNLMNAEMGEYESKSKEEIQFMIDEKQLLKESLFTTKDPRTDIQNALSIQNGMLSDSQKRITELEEKKKTYTNLSSIESEATVLKSEFARLQRTLKSLQQDLSTQEMSREEAEHFLDMTTTLKKQQESVEKINQELQLKVKQQEQFLENDMTRFYETCSRFSFLDMYNNIAKNFQDLFPSIEKNPLEPLELEQWLKECMEKVAAAKRILDIRMVEWQEWDKMADRKFNQLETKANTLQAECNQASAELNVKCSEDNSKYQQLEYEVQKARAERNALKETQLKLTEQIVELKNKQLRLEEQVQDTEKHIEELNLYKNELENGVEENFCVYAEAEAELRLKLLSFVIDARNRVHAPPTDEELNEAERNSISRMEFS